MLLCVINKTLLYSSKHVVLPQTTRASCIALLARWERESHSPICKSCPHVSGFGQRFGSAQRIFSRSHALMCSLVTLSVTFRFSSSTCFFAFSTTCTSLAQSRPKYSRNSSKFSHNAVAQAKRSPSVAKYLKVNGTFLHTGQLKGLLMEKNWRQEYRRQNTGLQKTIVETTSPAQRSASPGQGTESFQVWPW